MKIATTVKKKVEIPNEKLYETILKWYYEQARTGSDGWCVFSSFKDYIQCRYNMAINNEYPDTNWEKVDTKKVCKH